MVESSAGRIAPDLRDSLEKTGRRLTSDPIRTSLGLLPSGPDPVGEWLAHRQSPGPYLGPKGPESKLGVIKPGVRTGGDAVGQVRPINRRPEYQILRFRHG